ncbi:MAG TPA: hypothetical protein VH063_17010 [Gaiellaceae bacterium]|jgi:uncharacterized membrane protein|nr:hypothetical protein [Gaiellaceae bacterium]
MGTGSLVVSVFLASLVEMVEALTIVLAAALARGWRSALVGTAAAVGCLAIVIAALGPALTQIPLNTLRVVVGALLLIFGLQWLRKGILRASGYKALHDETAIFARELAAAEAAGPERSGAIDPYGFTLAFKGVFLEGLEVAFIVVTFGSVAGNVGVATVAAVAAVLVVAVVGVFARAPLARVPENTIKLAVGVMLTTFGIFWSTEGIGADWPGGDAAIPAVLAFVIALTWGLAALLRRRHATLVVAL